MTEQEKHLLLADLCARLPYGIFVKENRYSLDDGPVIYTYDYHPCIDNCKPYLRPMSSMTEEERIEFSRLLDVRYCAEDWEGHISTSYCIEIDNVYTDDEGTIKYPSSFSMDAIDWLNAHHFDYRGLIRMGFAVEAPKEMYT